MKVRCGEAFCSLLLFTLPACPAPFLVVDALKMSRHVTGSLSQETKDASSCTGKQELAIVDFLLEKSI